MATKFAVLQHSISKEHIGSVHKAGCRDIKREAQRQGSHIHEVEVADWQEAVAWWIDPEMEEMGWRGEDMKVHACAKRAAEATR